MHAGCQQYVALFVEIYIYNSGCSITFPHISIRHSIMYDVIYIRLSQHNTNIINKAYQWSGACPGIRKRGGPKSESFFFFFLLFNFSGGGPAQKLAEKMIFSTKKVAKYRWNSLIFALMTFFFFFFFFAFQFLGGGARAPGPPPLDTRLMISHVHVLMVTWVCHIVNTLNINNETFIYSWKSKDC